MTIHAPNYRTILLLCGVLCTMLHCKEEDQPLQTGFYYWKTNFNLNPFLINYLAAVRADQLFVKFADIVRHPTTGEIEPYALLTATTTSDMPVVPCFFITNSVFQNAPESQAEWLATKVLESLESVGQQWGKTAEQWPEIQFDCDWTATTRAAYFQFLTSIHQHLPQTRINCTIRLHQYQNPSQTGVPPAARGTLMCYNTGDIDSESSQNTIFTLKDAQKYQSARPYPIPLDLALPVFSWALVYRTGTLWRILPEHGASDFLDTTKYAADGDIFRVKKAHFTGGQYLRSGDGIRMETMTPEILRTGMAFWRTIRLAPDARLLFYHLDSTAVSRFSPLFIHELYDTINARQ